MKPETKFRTTQVIPFLKTLKNTAYFPIQQLAIVGDADYFLCCRGRFVALELKAKGERPRPIQQVKLDWVTKAKGLALVADPSNWERIKALLLKLDQGDDYDGGNL